MFWPFARCLSCGLVMPSSVICVEMQNKFSIPAPQPHSPLCPLCVAFLVHLRWEGVLVRNVLPPDKYMTLFPKSFHRFYWLCACVQVGVSCPDSYVCSLYRHHEVSTVPSNSLIKPAGCSAFRIKRFLLHDHFCFLARFNSRAQRYFSRTKKSSINLANGLTGSTDLEDNVTCDATAVLLKKGILLCFSQALSSNRALQGFADQCGTLKFA